MRPLLLVSLAFLAGCGPFGGGDDGGGGGAAINPGPATQIVTVYYAPGTDTILKERGPVLVSDGTTRQGLWTEWFPPDEGNGKKTEKTYVNGTWDQARYWREWNPDTSLRYDWQDN